MKRRCEASFQASWSPVLFSVQTFLICGAIIKKYQLPNVIFFLSILHAPLHFFPELSAQPTHFYLLASHLLFYQDFNLYVSLIYVFVFIFRTLPMIFAGSVTIQGHVTCLRQSRDSVLFRTLQIGTPTLRPNKT